MLRKRGGLARHSPLCEGTAMARGVGVCPLPEFLGSVQYCYTPLNPLSPTHNPSHRGDLVLRNIRLLWENREMQNDLFVVRKNRAKLQVKNFFTRSSDQCRANTPMYKSPFCVRPPMLSPLRYGRRVRCSAVQFGLQSAERTSPAVGSPLSRANIMRKDNVPVSIH